MKVVESGKFKVYVYDEKGQPHHLAHCHVRWDGKETVVVLPMLKVLTGEPLPKAGRELLRTHQSEIVEAWNLLNIRKANYE